MSAIVLFLIIIVMLMLLCFYQHKTLMIFAVVMFVCFAFGWVSQKELLANASNASLVTLVIIMILASVIEKTSILRKLQNLLIAKTEKKTLIKVLSVSALSSSVLNNTAVVAILIKAINNSKAVLPSRLLIPMSYATIMGGTLTLIGTSTNLVVSSMYSAATGSKGFGFFDFTAIGVVVTIFGCITLYFTSKFLPKKEPQINSYNSYMVEAEVLVKSSLIGKNVERAGLRHLEDLFLAEIITNKGDRICPVKPHDILAEGDKLLFSGDIQKVSILNQFDGLKLYAQTEGFDTFQLTEVLVKQDSNIIGKSLKEIEFRSKFDAAVVAVRRDGEKISGKLGKLIIKAGDFLLLATGDDFRGRSNISQNFLVIKGVEPKRVITGWREALVIFGFIAVIVYSVFSGDSMFSGMLILLGILVLTKSVSINEIKNSFPTEVWLIVTSSLCIATSMDNTGLAASIADFSRIYLAGHSAIVIFVGIFITTILLTEFITNNAAAALMFPVAYNLALGVGINIFPVVLGVAFAASASFLTPYGYQTNLMVMNAANYKWRDFIVTGVPVSIVYIVSCCVMIPIIYPLY
ncbi:SLC13 family permease [Francisella sciaenopsi]|uniref:SLC13 family permease n=1 Tax=Francisella sciaenopsi TaxID=3055034 RepID=A0ABQ6PKG4_9GAMM